MSSGDARSARERYGVDLIELETLRYGLIEAARDAHQALIRGSFSPIIRDVMDCTTCIHMRTPEGWQMVASWEGCMQHAFTSQHICNFAMAEWDEKGLGPGDVIVVNDPWRGAIHCADINLLRPVFVDGEAQFILHSTSHVVDLGGPIAGGFSNGVETHFEEQLKLPPTLLYAEDVPVRPVFNLLLENVRVPDAVLGDIRALYGCLVIGERRLGDLAAKYGAAALRAAGNYGMDMTEASLRAAIESVPDGDYPAEDFLDDDGVDISPVPLALTVKVRGDAMEIDFSGTGRQPLGNVGTAWIESSRCIEGVKLVLDPTPPVNSGTLRPIDVLLPAGSAVCVLPPSSCSNHVDIGGRVINMVTQSISGAVPERSIAADSGTAANMVIGGVDGREGFEGHAWGGFAMPGGGWGGTWRADGVTFCIMSIGNCRTSVHEHIERESPVLVWQMEVMPDSAGAGEHRGGFGGVYTFEVLSPTIVTVTADRVRTGAPGILGGGRGMPSYGWHVPPGVVAEPFDSLNLAGYEPLFGLFAEGGIPDPEHGAFGMNTKFGTGKFSHFPLEQGSCMRIVIGGGGGWGDPLDRDPGHCALDVANELHTPEFVHDAYGVVLEGGRVDRGATEARRAELRERRSDGDWEVPIAVPRHWSTDGKEGRR